MSSFRADMTMSIPMTDSLDSMMEGQEAHSALTNLAQVAIGERFIVRSVLSTGGAPEWQQQLEDIGFIVGEPVTIMTKGALGGDPLVVRIGLSTFAIRKAEAACVLVEPEAPVLKVAA